MESTHSAYGIGGLLDREIGSREDDAFGHRHFADMLRSVVESPVNIPPFSVGLLGPWGTGKSSIEAIYRNELGEDERRGEDKLRRRERIHTVTFNAWRYGGENIKRALLRHVFIELKGDEGKLYDALFRSSQQDQLKRRAWSDIRRDLVDNWAGGLAQVIVVLIATVMALVFIVDIREFTNDYVRGGVIGGFLLFAGFAVRYLLDPRRYVVPLYQRVTQIEAPHATAEQFEDLLKQQLKQYRKTEHGRKVERLVVFVDDLDRLTPDEMISGLDAVRTFMEFPASYLPEGMGVVFVIACDEEKIAAALSDRRRQRSGELPGAVFSRADARRYLDRIFQYRIEVPVFAKQDMRAFARAKLEEGYPQIIDDLSEVGASIEGLIDRLIHVQVSDPRSALQNLNAFAQSWMIAKQREREGSISGRPGGLQEGAVTAHPISLAAICALRVDFPDFYNDLEQEPGLINGFRAAFIDHLAEDQLPSRQRIFLRHYTTESGLKIEHQPLREYISSLAGLQFPNSLQPLIHLSQDPISRLFGDRAAPIHNAVVSGDAQALLRLLDRQTSTEPLEHDDIRLLKDMYDEVGRETSTRIENAFAALSQIAERIPPDVGYPLLDPLARAARLSDALRWRITLPKILAILQRFSPSERIGLVEHVVKDFLLLDGPVAFRAVDGSPLPIDTARDWILGLVPTLLELDRAGDLSDAAAQQLYAWMKARVIQVGDEKVEIEFSTVEEWIADFEPVVLRRWGREYLEEGIKRYKARDAVKPDAELFCRRVEPVLKELLAAGTQSRETAWAYICTLSNVRSNVVSEWAWETFETELRASETGAIQRFVDAVAARLFAEEEDPKNWPISWEQGGELLLRLLERFPQQIASGKFSGLFDLTNDWGRYDDDAGNFAAGIIRWTDRNKPDFSGEIRDRWAKRPLETGVEALRVLAEGVSNLQEDQRSDIQQALTAWLDEGKIEETELARYLAFWESLPAPSFGDEFAKESAIALLNRMRSQVNRPVQPIWKLVHALPIFLRHSLDQDAGTALNQILNTANQPDIFAKVAEALQPVWSSVVALKSFDSQIPMVGFERVIEVDPPSDRARRLLDSMEGLVTVIGTAEAKQRFREASLQRWPHDPPSAQRGLMAVPDPLEPETVVGLTEGVNFDDTEHVSALLNVWRAMASHQTLAANLDVTRLLLQKPPIGSRDQADYAVRLWLDCIEEFLGGLDDVLATILLDEEAPGDQRARLWTEAISRFDSLGTKFILSIVPDLVADPDDQMARTTVKSGDKLAAALGSIRERNDLGRRILDVFPNLPSRKRKKQVADLLGTLGCGGALRSENAVDGLSQDDRELLADFFPNSKSLRKWLGRWR